MYITPVQRKALTVDILLTIHQGNHGRDGVLIHIASAMFGLNLRNKVRSSCSYCMQEVNRDRLRQKPHIVWNIQIHRLLLALFPSCPTRVLFFEEHVDRFLRRPALPNEIRDAILLFVPIDLSQRWECRDPYRLLAFAKSYALSVTNRDDANLNRYKRYILAYAKRDANLLPGRYIFNWSEYRLWESSSTMSLFSSWPTSPALNLDHFAKYILSSIENKKSICGRTIRPYMYMFDNGIETYSQVRGRNGGDALPYDFESIVAQGTDYNPISIVEHQDGRRYRPPYMDPPYMYTIDMVYPFLLLYP